MPDDMYTYLIEQNASVAGFLAGERVKIIDLLYGVMLPSGADACLSLARSIAGTEQAFAKKMTEKAKEITEVGCRVQKQFMDYLHQGVTEEQLELMRLFAERVYENIKNIEEVI